MSGLHYYGVLVCPVCYGEFIQTVQTRVYCSTPCRMKAAKERDQIRKAEEQHRAKLQGYYRPRKPAVPVVTCWCGRKECRKHG